MKTRSELRDIIIKSLYQVYIYTKEEIPFDINAIVKEEMETSDEFVLNSINGVLNNQEDISLKANKYLKNWNIERLSKVDKAIISLGIYELIYTDTPNIVCINEAVELAKSYSDENVIKMINACLDQVYHNEAKDE